MFEQSLTLRAGQRAVLGPLPLPALADRIAVSVSRPTSGGPAVTWEKGARVRVTIIVEADAETLHCSGVAEGGARRDVLGREATDYRLTYGIPWGFFGARSGETKRLGEGKATYHYSVEIEAEGAIDSIVRATVTESQPRRVPFHSSIAFDVATDASESSDADGQISFSHAGGSGTDRAAFVACGNIDGAPVNINSATYGGAGMSSAWGTITANSGNLKSRGFGLAAIAAGTQTVVVTLAASGADQVGAACITMTGVHQSTPMGSSATSIADTTTPSATVPSVVSSDFLCDFVIALSDANPVMTAGANQTERTTQNMGFSSAFETSTQFGSDGGVMSWSLNEANYGQCLGAVAFKEASASGLTVNATTHALTLAAQSSSVSKARAVNATTHALTLAAQNAIVGKGREIKAFSQSFIFTPTSSFRQTIITGRGVNATAQALTLAAFAATVQLGNGLTVFASSASLTLEAQAATVTGPGVAAAIAPRGHRIVRVPRIIDTPIETVIVKRPSSRPRSPAPPQPQTTKHAQPITKHAHASTPIDTSSYVAAAELALELVLSRIKRRRS